MASRNESIESNTRCKSCMQTGRKPHPNAIVARIAVQRIKAEERKRIKELTTWYRFCPYCEAIVAYSNQGGRNGGFENKARCHNCRMKFIHQTRKSIKGRKDSDEVRKRKSDAIKAAYQKDPTYRERLAATQRSLVTDEMRKAQSERMLRQYKDTDFQKKIQDALKKHKECPNAGERRITAILDELFSGEYAFVGDGSFMVDTLNPDFVNKDRTKLIELFGEAYHMPGVRFDTIAEKSTEEGRKKVFATYGYSTCVIWCNEMKDMASVEAKLLAFHQS